MHKTEAPKLHRIIKVDSRMESAAAEGACHCPVCEHPFCTDPDAAEKSLTDKSSLPIWSRECSHSICVECLKNFQLIEAKGRRGNRPRVWLNCPICRVENSFNTKKLIIDRQRCALILRYVGAKKTANSEKNCAKTPMEPTNVMTTTAAVAAQGGTRGRKQKAPPATETFVGKWRLPSGSSLHTFTLK